MPSPLAVQRRAFIERLRHDIWGIRKGLPNNADRDSALSVAMCRKLADVVGVNLAPQDAHANTLGSRFADAIAQFLAACLPLMSAIRPGPFHVTTKPGSDGIARYAQFRHLRDIRDVLEQHPSLKPTLGTDYFVKPDILVFRNRLARDSAEIQGLLSIDDNPPVGCNSSLIDVGDASPLLFASVSVKWTIRSDRGQNTRTEALNLIRSRKGHMPHVVAATFEPLPSRLASLASGTGDIDCVYHGALFELLKAAEAVDPGAHEALSNLVHGHRLRDISDLPLDLAV